MPLKMIRPALGSAPMRLRPAPKAVDPFYRSTPWLAMMAKIKRVRGNRCEDCGVRASSSVKIIGDHIVERKDGGADLDPKNIRLRCTSCHNRKTAEAKRAREGGV